MNRRAPACVDMWSRGHGVVAARHLAEGTMVHSGCERTSDGRHAGPAGRRTILVVDDDPDVRDVVALALELEGYAVERAADGLDALLALKCAPPPALIVLDVEMTSMPGAEFRAVQLRDPALAWIPVLVLSSSVRDIDATLRLPKPVDPDVLVRAVRELAGEP